MVYDINYSTEGDRLTFDTRRLVRFSQPPITVRSLSVNPQEGLLSFVVANVYTKPAEVSWRFWLGGTQAQGSLSLPPTQQATVTANIAHTIEWMRGTNQPRARGELQIQFNYPAYDDLLRAWISAMAGEALEPYNRLIKLPVVIDLVGGGEQGELVVTVEGPGAIESVEISRLGGGETRRFGAEGRYPFLYYPGGQYVEQVARITLRPTQPDAFFCKASVDPRGYGPNISCDPSDFLFRVANLGKPYTFTVALGHSPRVSVHAIFKSRFDADVQRALPPHQAGLLDLLRGVSIVTGGSVDYHHVYPGYRTPDGRVMEKVHEFRLRAWVEITNSWSFPVTVTAEGGEVWFATPPNQVLSRHQFPPTTVQPGQTVRLEFQTGTLSVTRAAQLGEHGVVTVLANARLILSAPKVQELVDGRVLEYTPRGQTPYGFRIATFHLPSSEQAYGRGAWVTSVTTVGATTAGARTMVEAPTTAATTAGPAAAPREASGPTPPPPGSPDGA